MATRPSGLDDQRREALHPPVQGDVIDLDATLCEQLLKVAVRQPKAQRTANKITSGGNLNPANAAEPRWIVGQDQRRFIPVASPHGTCTLNATVPVGVGVPLDRGAGHDPARSQFVGLGAGRFFTRASTDAATSVEPSRL